MFSCPILIDFSRTMDHGYFPEYLRQELPEANPRVLGFGTCHQVGADLFQSLHLGSAGEDLPAV